VDSSRLASSAKSVAKKDIPRSAAIKGLIVHF